MRRYHLAAGPPEIGSASVLIALAFWLFGSAIMVGQQMSETLLVLGAGSLGTWTSEYTVSNTEARPLAVGIGSSPEVVTVCPPLTACVDLLELPPNGSSVKRGGVVPFGAVYLRALSGTTAPTVKARVFNLASPTQVLELPTFRLQTLLALNPTILTFPGATRSSSTRSNLVLAVLRPTDVFVDSSVSLILEVYSAEGERLGSRSLLLECCRSEFIVDVVSFVGVPALESGQLRVTKTGGNGVFWGIMPSFNSDGSLSVSLGANP